MLGQNDFGEVQSGLEWVSFESGGTGGGFRDSGYMGESSFHAQQMLQVSMIGFPDYNTQIETVLATASHVWVSYGGANLNFGAQTIGGNGKNYTLYLVVENGFPAHGGIGHTFIGGRDPHGNLQALGFYPKNQGFPWDIFSPGMVQNDTALLQQALMGDQNFAYETNETQFNATMTRCGTTHQQTIIMFSTIIVRRPPSPHYSRQV